MPQWMLTIMGLGLGLTGWWLLRHSLWGGSGEPTMNDTEEWPVLVKTQDHPQTFLIRDWLEQRGVLVIVEEETMKGTYATPDSVQRLRVAPSDYRRARNMLMQGPFSEYVTGEPEDGPTGPRDFPTPPRPAG